jgi:hypothetical protein
MALTVVVIVLLSATLAFADELVGVGDAPEQEKPPAATQATTQASTRPARASHVSKRNPPNIVDVLAHVDTADSWSDGTLVNANVVADEPARISMGFRQRGFPRTGTWIGPEEKTKCDFTDLVASFNPHTPANTGATLEVRVQQDGTWSPWLYMQSWGRVVVPPQRVTKFGPADGSAGTGEVDIDELILSKPAQAYQARIKFYSFGFDVNVAPSVRRLSVCYSGVVDDPKVREKLAPPTSQPSNWARDLKVPFRGQGAAEVPKAIRGMICSPTSVSMVLEHFGQNFSTLENCEAIYDPHWDLFGNWGRAVSRAGEMGLDSWLARFRTWDQVKAEVAQGNPVIASIRFKKGQVKGFLYESTGGHLIVIRGFKENGDVIVNDPANKNKGNGPVYPAAEFAKAWFDVGGVGYVIRKPAKPLPATLVKATSAQ